MALEFAQTYHLCKDGYAKIQMELNPPLVQDPLMKGMVSTMNMGAMSLAFGQGVNPTTLGNLSQDGQCLELFLVG